MDVPLGAWVALWVGTGWAFLVTGWLAVLVAREVKERLVVKARHEQWKAERREQLAKWEAENE